VCSARSSASGHKQSALDPAKPSLHQSALFAAAGPLNPTNV